MLDHLKIIHHFSHCGAIERVKPSSLSIDDKPRLVASLFAVTS